MFRTKVAFGERAIGYYYVVLSLSFIKHKTKIE